MASQKMVIATSVGVREGQKILSLNGPLTIHNVFDFQYAVRELGSGAVIVDFSGVPFIDSAGLGALVGARVAMQKANRSLALAALNPQVRALLDMSHVDQFFRIFSTIEEAQTALA
jgi:anti-sigma B factor antagonist